MPRSIWNDVIDFAMVNTSVEFYTDLEFGPSTYRNRFHETSMQLIEAALEAQGMGLAASLAAAEVMRVTAVGAGAATLTLGPARRLTVQNA